MAACMLRRLVLAGMVALLVGTAPLAQTPEDTRKAAEQGRATSQLTLGVAYATGEGLP